MAVNWIGFQTLAWRELVRTYKVINQVIWPPIITTVLYIFVFGLALGSRIKTVQDVPYAAFLIPGLIMLQVISATYDECSSSVFQGRFMNSIQELLIAPMSAVEIVGGYIVSCIVRALLIALVILAVGALFVRTLPQDWFLFFAVTILVAILFGALGIVFGLMAEKFDHIAVMTTFIITPLVFVGGVFTSIDFLPPAIRAASLFNPMFYMIDAFRYSFTLHSDEPLGRSLVILTLLAAGSLALALRLTAIGYKLRL
jgi:ABC-2 type transport system permease protein